MRRHFIPGIGGIALGQLTDTYRRLGFSLDVDPAIMLASDLVTGRVVSSSARRDGVRYDWNAAVLSSRPDPQWFEPGYWRARDAIVGEASGRGQAVFIEADVGPATARWVLRHYRRGGVLARWTRDLYLWQGGDASRAVREFHMLHAAHEDGLPVPRPVAARTIRRGVLYTADLLTETVPASETLADRLMKTPMASMLWRRCGDCIGQMHRLGIWHADLNARNLLVDTADQVFLIDFDRARCRRLTAKWRMANLARLRRSLDKFAAREPVFAFTEADWQNLTAGYECVFDAGGR